MYPHSLNPTHVSEGGNDLTSRWGEAFQRVRLEGIPTVLPHESLLFTARVGEQPNPVTVRPSLPYPRNSYGGPILLGEADKDFIG